MMTLSDAFVALRAANQQVKQMGDAFTKAAKLVEEARVEWANALVVQHDAKVKVMELAEKEPE